MRSEEILERLTAHQPARKGASEAEIATTLAKRKTTAALAASVKKAEEVKGLRA